MKDTWNPAELNPEISKVDSWNTAKLNNFVKRKDTWNPAELSEYINRKYNLEAEIDANIDNNTASFTVLEPDVIKEIKYTIDQEEGSASQLILLNDVMLAVKNEDVFNLRQFPTDSTGYSYEANPELIGGSVVWNQLVDTNTESVTIPSGHKYISKINSVWSVAISDGTAISVDGSRQDMVIDITAKLGTTIADYIYTLEQNTSGSGVAWFRKYFPEVYYAYSAPTIQSTKVSGKKVVGFNQCPNEWVSGSFNIHTGLPQTNPDWSITDFIKILPTTYYIKFDSALPSKNFYIFYYDHDQNFISNNAGLIRSGTFTPVSGASYIRLQYRYPIAQVTDHLVNLNISGSRNGEYEPYNPITYDLSGSHTVNRKYALVDLGSLSWTSAGSDTSGLYRYESSGISSMVKLATRNLISTYPIGANNNHTDGVQELIVHHVNKNIVVWSDKSTVSTFTTAMSGVYLLYELATPTTETVTNPTLYGIWKLDENNNLYFDGDTCDDIPKPMVVEAGGTEEYIDAAVEDGDRDVSLPVQQNICWIKDCRTVTVPDPPETLTDAEVTIDKTGAVTIIDNSGEEPATYTTSITPMNTLLGENYLTVQPGELAELKYTRIKPKPLAKAKRKTTKSKKED